MKKLKLKSIFCLNGEEVFQALNEFIEKKYGFRDPHTHHTIDIELTPVFENVKEVSIAYYSRD